MVQARDETGAVCFTADVFFDQGAVGASLSWGTWVRLGGGAAEVWGVAAEVSDPGSTDQVRTLIVASASADGPQRESYRLCWHRARGAQRYPASPTAAAPMLRFSAWAPDATAVEVVFGQPSGYVADDGYGADPGQPTVPLSRGRDGIWTAVADLDRVVGSFYTYRIARPGGSVNWPTDMFSREQWVASGFRCKSAGVVPGFMVRLGGGSDGFWGVCGLCGAGGWRPELAGWFE
jgi:1,4-alpha-glucan branching enzyme